MINNRKLNQIIQMGFGNGFFINNNIITKRLNTILIIIALQPNTTTVASIGCIEMAPVKCPLLGLANSTKRKKV